MVLATVLGLGGGWVSGVGVFDLGQKTVSQSGPVLHGEIALGQRAGHQPKAGTGEDKGAQGEV